MYSTTLIEEQLNKLKIIVSKDYNFDLLEDCLKKVQELCNLYELNIENEIRKLLGNYNNAIGEVEKLQIIQEKLLHHIATRIPKVLQNKNAVNNLDIRIKVECEGVLEQLIGNNLLQATWVDALKKVMKSICKIEVGKKVATGFIGEDGYLYTCNHVLETSSQAEHANVIFGYNTSDANTESYSLDTSDFMTSEEWDITRVKFLLEDEQNISKWGTLSFSLNDKNSVINFSKGDPVIIIQHPRGRTKELALLNSHVSEKEVNFVQYTADTEKGSSGSPVLNKDLQVIAIHRQSVNGQLANRGSLISNIEKVKKKK